MNQRIAHVTLLVRDYDEAIVFYTKVLGFSLTVDQDLGDPAVLAEGPRQGALLLLRVGPPVARVGDQLRRCYLGVADDPVPPGRSWSGGRLHRHLSQRPCIVAPTA